MVEGLFTVVHKGKKILFADHARFDMDKKTQKEKMLRLQNAVIEYCQSQPSKSIL